ncbi:MAG: type II toxin-antitoxin system VapC family toxin [Gemmatimonadota bacterium]
MASDSLVVLDSSAVIAFAGGEAGADVVGRRLLNAAISAVNAVECISVLARFLPISEAATVVSRLGLRIVPCDWDIGVVAASIHAATRDRGLSLGDCICLATAKNLGVSALTADGAWRGLSIGVEINLIR